MASASTQQWWIALEKSNLLSAEQLAEARAEVTDTLAIGENLVLVSNVESLNHVQWRGSNNVLVGTTTYASTFDVPLLRTFADWSQAWGQQGSVRETNRVPQFEAVTPRSDAYTGYRIRRGHPAATMAVDGGPVGVRFEYLPEMRLRR